MRQAARPRETRRRWAAGPLALLAVVLALLLPAEAGASATPARSAASFLDSVGVNVHLGYTGTPYHRFARVRAALVHLGVHYVRDGIALHRPDVYAELRRLAAAGIKVDAIAGDPLRRWGTGPLPAQLDLLSRLGPRVIASLEGPNEFDNEGISSWVPILRHFQRQLWQGAKARPRLASIPVLGPSLVDRASRGELGSVSAWTSEGSFHPYPGGEPPDSAAHMQDELALAARNTGSEQVQATETGYTNAIHERSGQLPTSEEAAATYMPRLLLDDFRRGIRRTYVYELIDATRDPRRSQSDSDFGLLRHDLSPKPAYTAVRNLLTILSDRPQPFPTGSLDYAVDPAPPDLHQVLLEKHDGTFWVALWRSQSVWDPQRRRALPAATSAATLRLATAASSVRVFAPNRSSQPLASYQEVSAVPLSLGPRVVLVEVTPHPELAPRLTDWLYSWH